MVVFKIEIPNELFCSGEAVKCRIWVLQSLVPAFAVDTYLEIQACTRKILENIFYHTQSYVSNCTLDAWKVSLSVPFKTHKINVIKEPGRYLQTGMEMINTIQSFKRILYSDHYGNLNWAWGPWFNKAFRLPTSHWFPI